MTDEWYWVLGINPEPWEASKTHFPKKGQIRTFKSGKLGTYQAALHEEVERLWEPTPIEGPFELRFLFDRDTAGGQPADVTNLQKAAEDALQGVLYANDREARYVSSRIVDQFPGHNPRIGIQIRPVSDDWKPEVRAALRRGIPRVQAAVITRDRSDFDVEDLF